MRELRFRANDTDGNFIYSDDFDSLSEYFEDCDLHGWQDQEQYIGYPDDKDIPICEGDKIQILYTDWISQTDYSIPLEEYKKSISQMGKVFYVGGAFRLLFDDGSIGDLNPGVHGERYIIGNIHQ